MSKLLPLNSRYLVVLGLGASILMGIQFSRSLQDQSTNRPSSSLAPLEDGRYQLCSQPEPDDWRDGAGVCLRLQKLGRFVQGYYGYPHSDNFICLQGYLQDTTLRGQAAAPVGWGWSYLDNPNVEFFWDQEQYLQLRGKDSQQRLDQTTGYHWVLLPQATLDIKALHIYSTVQMRSPDDLCPWSLMATPEDPFS